MVCNACMLVPTPHNAAARVSQLHIQCCVLTPHGLAAGTLQEAFRSVEDIQGLMALGRKAPKPQMMASYYARLTRIFTVSGSHLYNGYAWCAAQNPRCSSRVPGENGLL